MSMEGIHDVCITEGTVDGEQFSYFVRIHSPDLSPAEEVFSQMKYIMEQNHKLFKHALHPWCRACLKKLGAEHV